MNPSTETATKYVKARVTVPAPHAQYEPGRVPVVDPLPAMTNDRRGIGDRRPVSPYAVRPSRRCARVTTGAGSRELAGSLRGKIFSGAARPPTGYSECPALRCTNCLPISLILTTDARSAPLILEQGLATRVQLVEGAMAALDHLWNDIVASVTDGDLEAQEDLCRCEDRRPLPADQDEDSRPQPPPDTVQRILEGVPHELVRSVARVPLPAFPISTTATTAPSRTRI